MRDYNEFGGGKRYRSEEGLSKKKQINRRPTRAIDITSKIFNLPSAYVSETEEEESKSSEEDRNSRQATEKRKRGKVIMSLGHLSMLINKKIFTDDFDKNSFSGDMKQRYKKGKGMGTQSMIDQPIHEEQNEQFENDYLSDSSSSSQFSL